MESRCISVRELSITREIVKTISSSDAIELCTDAVVEENKLVRLYSILRRGDRISRKAWRRAI